MKKSGTSQAVGAATATALLALVVCNSLSAVASRESSIESSSVAREPASYQPAQQSSQTEEDPATGEVASEVVSEDLRKIWDSDAILKSLTRRKQSELPRLKASFSEDDEHHMQASENFFYRPYGMNNKNRLSDYILMALVAKSHAMVYSDFWTHRYDNFNDLKLAAGPEVNQRECIERLENLTARAEVLKSDGLLSRDTNLLRLLDTWFHAPTGLLVGNAFDEGRYRECHRLDIVESGGGGGASRSATRYCVATIKHRDWPKIDKYDVTSLKGGVCLPKSCDSSNFENKYQLIMGLFMLNMRQLDQGHFRFHSLYCMPDEDSPLRSLWNSPKAVATLGALGLWVALLIYCTIKHEQLRKTHESLRVAGSKFGLTNMNANSDDQADQQPATTARMDAKKPTSEEGASRNAEFKFYSMLSITHNFKALFSTDKASSMLAEGGPEQAAERKVIDLSCIEGIKVIAMVYVIMGHVLMCITSLMTNGREMAGNFSMAFFLANLVPAFAVNSFFTITGLLTSYLMFKQNQSMPFITSPAKWVAFIVYRYLRIMPMYALVVLYCKTLAKYAGSGPLWDYATSQLGQRRVCEQEPWFYTLLFGSNFLPPLEHCIPGGWYLSNDFQFFLVTPLFLALLHKRPRLGRLALVGGVLAGYLNGFHSIFSAQVVDLKPIAVFAPHGFKTYVSHFSFNYTQPQYRIPAYLIGLLVGYQLYEFERKRVEFYAARRRLASGSGGGEQASDEHDRRLVAAGEPDWSARFKRFAIPVCLVLVALCCSTPVIGAMLPFSRPAARFMVALITPSYHVLFAASVGLYLLMSTTGQGNQLLDSFLSLSFWKPLARVSLCAVLVNVEVINYIIQTNSNLHYINNQFQASLNVISILATYAVAVVVCVLFESPIRAALNTLLTYVISRVAGKSRRKLD